PAPEVAPARAPKAPVSKTPASKAPASKMPAAETEAPPARPRKPRKDRPMKLPLEDVVTEVEAAPASRRRRAPASETEAPAQTDEPEGGPELLTRTELAELSGVTEAMLDALEEYGLLTAAVTTPIPYFDRDDVAIVVAAAAFGRYGIEARHLKAYE